MALYDLLTDEEKKIVDNSTNWVRGMSGEIARLMNRVQALKDDQNAIDIIMSLDENAVIPNTSGLAGSDNLTRAEVVQVFSTLDGIRDTHDTTANRNAWTKAAGVNAMVQ